MNADDVYAILNKKIKNIAEPGTNVTFPDLAITNQAAGTPVGEIINYMGTAAPVNYLVCDGTEYNISDYPYLTQHFIDHFGTVNYFGGDGTDTFAVPDLRGEFLRGTGTASRNTGTGSDVGTHQNGTSHIAARINQTNDMIIGGPFQTETIYSNCDTTTQANRARYIRLSQEGNFVETKTYTTRPTNTAIMFCIKYQPTYFMSTQATYSYGEKQIGTWVDGKPLYEKTINFEVLPNADTGTVSHGIENVDEIWIYDGYVKDLNSALRLQTGHSHTQYVQNSWNCSVDKTSVAFTTGTNRSEFSAIVTVRYTKTEVMSNSEQ